jgi:hypothetical protein
MSSLTNSPVDKELGVTISDRRSVRKISRWTVQLFDWEVVEGCNVNQTNPATYRASFVTGKGKQVETGYTCDDEEY